jgi:TolC family type I secretion outer membrane protein
MRQSRCCRAFCRPPVSFSESCRLITRQTRPLPNRAEVGGAAPARPAQRSTARAATALAAITGGGLFLTAFAAPAQTLTQALAEAYITNPQLLAQRALLRATDEQVPQALSGWRPTVNFTGNIGGTRSGFTTPPTTTLGITVPSVTTFNTFQSNSFGVAVTQPIYSGGRTVAQTRQAIQTVQSTRAQTLAVETSVLQSVAQAYLDVVRDQALVEVNRNNVRVLREQLTATQDRFRVGEVTRTDVAQAEASLAQAIGNLTSAEGALAQSRAAYVAAVGQAPGILLLPRERPALPATREEAQSLAANNNFSVISANFAELAARDNIDVVRGQLLPQISLLGNVSRVASPNVALNNSVENSGSITLQMTMPLYEAGAIYSQTRQAEQTVGQRRSQVDQARRTAVQAVTDAWEALKSGRAAVVSFAAAVRAAQIALQGTQQEALVGTATTLDVLIQTQTLLTAQSSLVVAEHDTAIAEYNITAATGRLIAPELHLPVKLYDMDAHYREVKGKWAGFGGGLRE